MKDELKSLFKDAAGVWVPLADALAWRMQRNDTTTDGAFAELAKICSEETVGAFGVRMGNHPDPAKDVPAAPNLLQHTFASYFRLRRFPGGFTAVPTSDWSGLVLTPGQKRLPDGESYAKRIQFNQRLPDVSLSYRQYLRAAWQRVFVNFETLEPIWFDRLQAAQAAAQPIEPHQTGLPGRPAKSWDLIRAEVASRYEHGERHHKTTQWADALMCWLKTEHPSAAQPSRKTLTNSLRPLLRTLEKPPENTPEIK